MINYLNIKEYPKDKGILIDSCNSEKRLYHNGCYYDLCGMSVQDYINSTLLNCNSSGGSDEPVKKMNTVIFTVNSNNELIIYCSYGPKDDLKISFSVNGEIKNINIGKGVTTPVVTDLVFSDGIISINNITITPLEDENYKYGDYKIINGEMKKECVMYYGLTNSLTYQDVDENVVKTTLSNIQLNEENSEITFIAPAAKENVDDLTDEEYELWEKEHSYFKTILIPSILYVNDNDIKINYLINGLNAFIGFKNIKTLNIDEIEYVLLVDIDEVCINSSMVDVSEGTYTVSLK